MTRPGRHYHYVGPAEMVDLPASPAAVIVDSPTELANWLAAHGRDGIDEPFTFVIALDRRLRLAPRRSEHTALAGGHEVLAAGEMTFARADAGWHVVAATNQSTGYCPDSDSWPPVGAALDHLDIAHPGGFTEKITFRLCPSCGERNIVRDDNFVCALCDSDLPTSWNFTWG